MKFIKERKTPRHIHHYYEDEELGTGGTLEISTYYSLGGRNMFTGEYRQRGYYLSVTPVGLGERTIEYSAFSGLCAVVKRSQRFSQGTLEKLAEHYLNTTKGALEVENLLKQLKVKQENV